MKQGLKIVFEDDWLIVVEKPSGLLTMATDKGREITAYSMLYDYINEEAAQKGGKRRGPFQNTMQPIFIVHRLDRDTSGLLVFAKDEETKRALQDNWEEAVQERKYIAVLEGQINDDEGYIETWMYENPRSLMVHCYDIRPGDTPQKPPRKDTDLFLEIQRIALQESYSLMDFLVHDDIFLDELYFVTIFAKELFDNR